MHHLHRRALVALVAGAGLTLTGCGSGKTPSTTTSATNAKASPAPAAAPKVTGKILISTGEHQFKIFTQQPDGRLTGAPFAVQRSNDFEYEVTADHKLFVYRDGTTVKAYHLADGTEQQLAADAAPEKLCLRTSPDSRHVSYRRADDLVVADLTGKITVLDKVKRADYSPGGGDIGKIHATTALGCAEWLDDTHVTFARVKKLPDNINVHFDAMSSEITADTTTVAVLTGRTAKLLDSPTMWHPTATCGTRVATLAATNGDQLHLRDRTGDAELTAADTFTGPARAIPATTGGTHAVVFTPVTCQPLLYTVAARTLQAVDPTTRAVTSTPLVTLPAGGNDVRIYDDPAMWRPTPTDQALATVVNKQIVIVDIKAGTAIPAPGDPLDNYALLVAWLD